MSHTVTVKVELKNREALSFSIGKMGGKILGKGTHRLFQGNVEGFGFRLNGWSYPLVLKADGDLAYDDYSGHWGNVKDLEKLKGLYTMTCAEMKARELGWYTEVSPEEITIYHPSGGVIKVTASGVVDAEGFIGSSCSSATGQLEAALGSRLSETQKAEYNQTQLAQWEIE